MNVAPDARDLTPLEKDRMAKAIQGEFNVQGIARLDPEVKG